MSETPRLREAEKGHNYGVNNHKWARAYASQCMQSSRVIQKYTKQIDVIIGIYHIYFISGRPVGIGGVLASWRHNLLRVAKFVLHVQSHAIDTHSPAAPSLSVSACEPFSKALHFTI